MSFLGKDLDLILIGSASISDKIKGIDYFYCFLF